MRARQASASKPLATCSAMLARCTSLCKSVANPPMDAVPVGLGCGLPWIGEASGAGCWGKRFSAAQRTSCFEVSNAALNSVLEMTPSLQQHSTERMPSQGVSR